MFENKTFPVYLQVLWGDKPIIELTFTVELPSKGKDRQGNPRPKKWVIRAGVIPEAQRYLFANKLYAYSPPIAEESDSRLFAEQILKNTVGQGFQRTVYDKLEL